MEMSFRGAREIRSVILRDCMPSLEEFIAVAKFGARLEFSEQMKEAVRANRKLLDKFINEGRIIYGVTTGFGENVRYTISPKDATTLQENIIRTHSVAVGKPLDREQARAAMLMTIINAGKGHSGIRLETLELIRDMLNLDLIPFAPSEGSVAYLGVEAHIAMAYIGEGKIFENGVAAPAREVLEKNGLVPLTLSYKEGLTMTNGTITVTALAALALYDAIITVQNIELAGGLCYEALRATTKALDPRIHAAKRHVEQASSARNLLRMLEGSEICEKYRDAKVQDAYVLRSMAQLHGSAKRLVKEAYEVIMEEMSSISDNPELFDDEANDGVALMCGNFEGTFVGSHADMIAIACGILANVAERCTDRMVNRNLSDGLPPFLVATPGLNSGMMITQYTAAALVNEIRHLAIPVTVDNVPTCANQEDPVSMAYYASKKAGQAVRKLQYIAAIEVYVALQALDFLKPMKSSPALAQIRNFIREKVAFVDKDRFLHADIEYIFSLVKNGTLVEMLEKEIGKLEF